MESINSQNPDYSKTFLLEIKEEHIDQNHLIEEEINQLRQQHSNNHKKTEEDLKNPNIKETPNNNHLSEVNNQDDM